MVRDLKYALSIVGWALAAGAALSCGSESSSSPVVEVTAVDLRFVPETIQIPAGQTVTLRLKNLDETEHDLEVRGLVPASLQGGGHEGMTMPNDAMDQKVAVHTEARKTASLKFRADQKGTYEVFCTVPGHEQLGMVAKLAVS